MCQYSLCTEIYVNRQIEKNIKHHYFLELTKRNNTINFFNYIFLILLSLTVGNTDPVEIAKLKFRLFELILVFHFIKINCQLLAETDAGN